MNLESFTLDQLRTRLQNMDDAALERFGKAARYLCSPEANFGEEPRPEFLIQLEEARAEWRRRHPKIDLEYPTAF